MDVHTLLKTSLLKLSTILRPASSSGTMFAIREELVPKRLGSRMNQEAVNGILRATMGARFMETDAQILLVEDEDELRDLLRTVLRSKGYSVTEACDCHTALDLLQRQNFDVVLLDINLPDGKGFRVAEAIRENHLTSKVIVMTGTGGIENAMRGAAFGVEDFLTKPVHPNYLLRSIEHALSVEPSG